MASITKAVNKSLIDSLLPTYGNPRANVPVWNEGQRMFICEEYEAASGNRYYKGVRFCNNLVVVETVGKYHTWTYIDKIELYAFNGTKLEIVQTQSYDKTFYDGYFIKSEIEKMITSYLAGSLKMQNLSFNMDGIKEQAKSIVDSCYKSFLDPDFNTRLTNILPQIGTKE